MLPLLQVQDLTLQFHGSSSAAVESACFSLQPGETVGILGESGAGKTTLARAILRLLPPRCEVVNGSIQFRGTEILYANEKALQKIRGAQVSLIGQDPELALNPVIPAGEQVAEVIRAHSQLRRGALRVAAHSILEAVGLPPQHFYWAYPHQLSGGQRQRVVIAQALACKPQLLIADEPTSALDNILQAEILDLLKRLRDRLQLALLFITHNPALLSGLADRVLVMQAGRIVEEGTFEQIYWKPRHPFTQTLLKSIPPHPSKTVHHLGRQSLAPLLEARHLCKSYVRGGWRSHTKSHILALDDVSLHLDPGSTLALVGPSGSGKSTLARCLARLEDPDAGEVLWKGKNLMKLAQSELIPVRRQIQLIFQHSAAALNPRLSAAEIISEPLRIRSGISKKERREHALALMEQVGLSSQWAERRPHQFSGGQRQRLAIARALILKPDLVILDEAFSGLDLSTQAQIVGLLENLQDSFSLSYLFISHDLRMAAHLAGTIAIMSEGRIIEFGNAAEILSHPRGKSRDLIWSIPQVVAPLHTGPDPE